MRATIYARYSSELQSESSLDGQIQLCRERIQSDGHEIVQVYRDRAVSGATLIRPGIQSLLEDAEHQEFDVVYSEALDRISRDQEDVASVFKRLRFADVKIVTLSEGEISELHVGLTGTLNALYLRELANKTRRGLRGRIEEGRSAGGNSYGYDVVNNVTADDKKRGLRRINKDEAVVVCRVLADYADGKSPRAIAKALNAEGIPGPSGGTWGPSTINGNAKRGTGLLNNELYIGFLVWNRLRYLKDPSTGKRRSRLNPSDQWIVKEVPEVRIVPQELWDRVKKRQATLKHKPKKTNAFWSQQRPRYLLSGLMKCGVCGAGYTKMGHNRFGCTGHRDRGTCSNNFTIRTDEIEAVILDGLKHRLMEPHLFEMFAKEFTAEVNRQRMALTEERRAKESRLAAIKKRVDQLVDAICDGANARAVNEKLKELEAEQDNIVRELKATPADQPLLHPALATLYRQHVERLDELLTDEEEQPHAFELIRSLIDEVCLVPEGGQLAVELKGDLAGILAISNWADSKGSAANEKSLQIKMVAGAGFEPTTFRL